MTDAMARPGYDPGLELALDAFPAFPLLNDETMAGWRAGNMMDMAAFNQTLTDAGVVREDRTIPGPGGNIELTILRPADSAGTLKGLLHVHGGGMVLGDRFGNILDLHVHQWVRQFGLVVISVEYRLGPEFPAPAGVEDTYAALEWVASHTDELGIDPDHIIVEGISGGGGLAAGAVLMARDKGGPKVFAQMLVYPMLDDRNTTSSALQYAVANGRHVAWPTESNAWAWDAILGPGHEIRDDISPYTAPSRANDLSGLPTTYLDAGSAEVFRDEVGDYASRLWAGGTQAELHIWSGGFHGFDLFAPTEPLSIAAHATREDWLRRLLDA